MSEHMGGERYTVELEAMPSDIAPAVRLRQWLKSTLRSARFRALSVRDTTPKLPPVATPTTSQGEASPPQPTPGAVLNLIARPGRNMRGIRGGGLT